MLITKAPLRHGKWKFTVEIDNLEATKLYKHRETIFREGSDTPVADLLDALAMVARELERPPGPFPDGTYVHIIDKDGYYTTGTQEIMDESKTAT